MTIGCSKFRADIANTSANASTYLGHKELQILEAFEELSQTTLPSALTCMVILT